MLSNDSSLRQFTELVNSYACENVITEATRITPNTASLLDICITNKRPPLCAAGVLSAEISDHLPVFCLIPLSLDRHQRQAEKFIRKINDQSLEHFRGLVSVTDWASVCKESDPNKAYALFLEKLVLCYEQAFPLELSRPRCKKIRKPWISRQLLKKIKKKNNMFHSFLQSRDLDSLSVFKKYRNHLMLS